MLRLDTIAEQRPFSIEVGDYSPLQIEIEPRVLSIDESYYWRSTNGNYLFEIKVHASNGAVAEAAVVLVPKDRIVRTVSIQELCDVGVENKGVPLFQTAPWRDRLGHKETGIDPALRRYDERLPFQLLVADDGVAVLFDGCSPHSAVRNGDISFLFNSSNQLCGVKIEDRKIGQAAVRAYC